MYLFGLGSSSFILSLGLMLLLAGAIMFYTLKRFSILENNILEQGRILHSFINRMQEREVSQPEPIMRYANADIESQKVVDMHNVHNIDKINVSDNDESNIETSSEYDSDENYESDESNNNTKKINDIYELDNKNNENNENNLEVNVATNDATVKIISIEDLQPDMSLEVTDAVNIHSSDSDSYSESNTDLDSVTDVLDVKNQVTAEIKRGGVTKMKVGQLRELVCKEGLVTSMDDANKLKKEKLLKLLQEN